MTLDAETIARAQETVEHVFRSVRPELLKVHGSSAFTRKDNHSPVTEWDVMVENRLRAKLEADFPELGFEGEETGHFGSTDAYWLVDPIDGTSSFIRGLHYCTNMAALVVDGVVIAAVIYDFVSDHVYTARKGEGAFKDGKPIHVNTTRAEGDHVIYSLTRTRFSLIREALGTLKMRTLLPMGAAGHAYMMLAEGKIDGMVVLDEIGLHDNAPGVLIAEEAGAVLLPYDEGVGVHRRKFIIGSPQVVDAIEHSGLI